MKQIATLLTLTLLMVFPAVCEPTEATKPQPKAKTTAITHSRIGEKVVADSSLTVTCINQRRHYGSSDTYDEDINSPKSATFSRDGKKIYVNSLEGCATVVYDAATLKKLKVIKHKFDSGKGQQWLTPSGFYEFTHYPDGASRSFLGKPVEAALTPDGKYMFVPYYRRTFDLNAQDPSALAVIDTRTDEIVLMTETGPLPKMVAVSHDGHTLAITHWGNNTVGFIDISDPDPKKWRHLPPVTIGNKLNLNYSLTTPVNRDSGSGFLLRGTVFLPGDSLMLVSGMAGPMAVIDIKQGKWLGMLPQLHGVRHITLNGDMLYFSRNSAGEVMTLPVTNVVDAITGQRDTSRQFNVNGIRTCKVGGGARTLKVSPSGRFIFVACNTASHLYIVDSRSMRVIGKIAVDSYPVGLDISPDGTMIATTSQGRKNAGGGNSVNFFKIEYNTPEPLPAPPVETLPTDTISPAQATPAQPHASTTGDNTLLIAGGGVAALLIVGGIALARRKR